MKINVWNSALKAGCRDPMSGTALSVSKPVAASKNAPVQYTQFQPHFYICSLISNKLMYSLQLSYHNNERRKVWSAGRFSFIFLNIQRRNRKEAASNLILSQNPQSDFPSGICFPSFRQFSFACSRISKNPLCCSGQRIHYQLWSLVSLLIFVKVYIIFVKSTLFRMSISHYELPN